ncbi:hypothetical protein SKAU_G00275050 [Synaphobranchus kaupii]|uniref:Uncharacterized protein n=1 Tax=Synaphobranchus kaupii TaxID=118154 RepID=A0A9Q1IQZ3_SYNKA|nr:hypothetical protein SKAU_G00275050 [Synaphobranchus kaupii]
MKTVLDRWREALTEPEWALLTDYLAGNKSDIASDPFPELSIAPDLNRMEYNGPMLDFGDCEGERMQGFAADSAGHPEADAGEVGSEQAQRTEAQGCQDGVGTRRRMGRVRAGPCRQTLRLARKRLCQSSLLQLRAG